MLRTPVENLEEIVQLRTANYVKKPEVRPEPSPVDLVRRLDSYIRLNQESLTSKALRATGVPVEALADAIRETCRFAEVSQQETLGLEKWGAEAKQWYLNAWNTDKTERKELNFYEEGKNEAVQLITMNVLGIPAFFTRQTEKLCKLLEEQGLIVDQVQDQRCITWKAPLKPDLASSEEISAVITFVHNEAAEKLWWGIQTFEVARRKIKAVNPAAYPEYAFKMRPIKERKGRVGVLAEISHLLRMNGMSTGQISEIYRQSCLRQGLAILDMVPNAGMVVNVPTKQKQRNTPAKKVFAAVGVDQVVQQREVDWVARASSAETMETILHAFDRHGSDRAGVGLGLITGDERLKRWFTVQMEAFPLKNPSTTDGQGATQIIDPSTARETFDVLLQSTAASGRFTRREVELLCDSDNTCKGKIIRTLRKKIGDWSSDTIQDVLRIHTSCDPATHAWDGGKLLIQMASSENALRLIHEFPAQIWGAQGNAIPISLAASSRNLLDNNGVLRRQTREFEWSEIELDMITNEISIPEADERLVVDSITAALEEFMQKSKLKEAGQVELRIEGAVEELFETMPSPGNASFPTLKEWAETASTVAEQSEAMIAFKDKVKNIDKEHSWSVAKKKGAFAATGRGRDGEKKYRTGLLFLALNKLLALHPFSSSGMISERNDLVFTISTTVPDQNMEELAAGQGDRREGQEETLSSPGH